MRQPVPAKCPHCGHSTATKTEGETFYVRGTHGGCFNCRRVMHTAGQRNPVARQAARH